MATYKIQIDDKVRNATADEAAQIEAAHAEAKPTRDKRSQDV